jgi:hypothetical protein
MAENFRVRRFPGPTRITQPISFYAGRDVTLADLADEAAEICCGGVVFVASAWSSLQGARILWDLTGDRIKIEGLLIGVSRQFTDREALYAARGVADSAYVYLDGNTQGQIAHFKIMRFKGPGKRRKRIAIVGSGNLTRGGLLDNEEAYAVIYDDKTAPEYVRKALDDVDGFLDEKLRSGYAQLIDPSLIARLVESGMVPVISPHARTDARYPGRDAISSAQGNHRRAYTYQRRQPFRVPPFEGTKPKATRIHESTLPGPMDPVFRRFVKFYGISESNRSKNLRGTQEFNVSMPGDAEREFWGYSKFRLNREKKSKGRKVSVRFRLGKRVQIIRGGRVYQRLRPTEGGSRIITETRFRPLNVKAMRTLYNDIDISKDALLVVEHGQDDIDFEVRVVLPSDADYASLVPQGYRRRQQYMQ